MTKYLSLLLFIELAVGRAQISIMRWEDNWTLILLILVIRGGIKVGKWEGSKKRIRLKNIQDCFTFIFF